MNGAGGLPNLLIAGVPKAGTSSLFSYLAQHPDICPAKQKETGFFSNLIPADGTLPHVDAYRRHFADCGCQTYLLEATPSYCYGGDRLLQAIKSTLAQPRIIIILRDPIERLWSGYTFQRSLGHLPGIRSFGHYVDVCQEQRRRGEDFIIRGHFNGLSIGFYGSFLGRWFETFPGDVRVLFFEDLSLSPAMVVAELCRWLGIDDEVVKTFDLSARNVTAHPRSARLSRLVFELKNRTDDVLRRIPMMRGALRKVYLRINSGPLKETRDPSTTERLEDMYRDSNRAVAELLKANGTDQLPVWLDIA